MKISLFKKKTRETKEDLNKLRYGFSKSNITEIRKNLYEIKNWNKRDRTKSYWVRRKSF